MDTLTGEATLPFSFLSPFLMAVNSKKKEFASYKQILSFNSRSHFERTTLCSEANRKSQKLFPFINLTEENQESIAIRLEYSDKTCSITLCVSRSEFSYYKIAPVFKWVKCWPTDLAVPSLWPARG